MRETGSIARDVRATLAVNAGNQTHTAKQLQIGAATLYRKLKSYGMIGARQEEPVGTE